jgi:hypothetical protein
MQADLHFINQIQKYEIVNKKKELHQKIKISRFHKFQKKLLYKIKITNQSLNFQITLIISRVFTKMIRLILVCNLPKSKIHFLN